MDPVDDPIAGIEPDPDWFRFTALLMIVVFGVLVATVPTTLVTTQFGHAELLTIAALALFVEAYLVLNTYHRQLELGYDLTWLMFDVLLMGLYVIVVRLIEASDVDIRLLQWAMALGVALFLALFLRQVLAFVVLPEGPGSHRLRLITSMAADFAGMAVCGGIWYLVANASGAVARDDAALTGSIVAVVVVILYFVIKYPLASVPLRNPFGS